jgi:hypothetical protein
MMFLEREYGEHCIQRACTHTTCSECNISELAFAQRLEFYNWLDSDQWSHCYLLFTDMQSHLNSVHKTHISHVWLDKNPHDTV